MINVVLTSGLMLLAMTIAQQSPPITSTPEERAEWVEIAHKLETNPLDEVLDRQGEQAVGRLSDVHDIHVVLCPAFLFEFDRMKYRYAHALRRQFMLASAAFVIENPQEIFGRPRGYAQQNVVAVESVLNAYKSIVQQKPSFRYKLLDDLLDREREGKLPEYVRKRCP